MKRFLQASILCVLVLSLSVSLSSSAYALTEAEVQAQVDAVGRESVTGNLLIWFFCAVAFLKISQKIDSIMSTLGLSAGRTGGSLLGEAMIVMRTITMAAGSLGHTIDGRASGASARGDRNGTGFFQGGLIGIASRRFTNDAIRTVTTQHAAVNTAANSVTGISNPSRETSAGISDPSMPSAAGPSIADDTALSASPESGGTMPENSAEAAFLTGASETVRTQKDHSEQTSATSATSERFLRTGIGGAMFANSLQSDGRFANEIIGTVATGDMRSTGSITGDLAAQSLSSYMGHTALGDTVPASEQAHYSNVEIGGGRITGTEISLEHPEGASFGMYHVGQYMEPTGTYDMVTTADGQQWYRQYAVDTVQKTPFTAPDGTIDYNAEIVKRLPAPPKRKDRV